MCLCVCVVVAGEGQTDIGDGGLEREFLLDELHSTEFSSRLEYGIFNTS